MIQDALWGFAFSLLLPLGGIAYNVIAEDRYSNEELIVGSRLSICHTFPNSRKALLNGADTEQK
jgi:hypothetical protein